MEVLSLRYEPQLIEAKTKIIAGRLLTGSSHIRQPNFDAISGEDIATLFRLYDEMFFEGWLEQHVTEKATRPMQFRVSSRMSRAGGKTIRHQRRYRNRQRTTGYEIAVASRLLFLTFGEVDRPVTIGGMICENRLQALQRIMEHEIVHLFELLEWGKSSCNQPRFKQLVRNIFGHSHVRHDLVAPEEHAAHEHDVHVGATATFAFEDQHLIGRVNRINRRATILVEHPDGNRYSDGKRYKKYYVPLQYLRPLNDTEVIHG